MGCMNNFILMLCDQNYPTKGRFFSHPAGGHFIVTVWMTKTQWEAVFFGEDGPFVLKRSEMMFSETLFLNFLKDILFSYHNKTFLTIDNIIPSKYL